MRKVLLLSIFCTKHCWKLNVVFQVTCSRDHVEILYVWMKCCQLLEGASIPRLLHCSPCQKLEEIGAFAAPWQTGHTDTRPRKAPGGVAFLQMGQLENASIPQPGHCPAYWPRELTALLWSYCCCLILLRYLSFSEPNLPKEPAVGWAGDQFYRRALSMWGFSD